MTPSTVFIVDRAVSAVVDTNQSPNPGPTRDRDWAAGRAGSIYV